MATTAKMARQLKTLKYGVRERNRCKRCGRPRAYLRRFEMCRVCFRALSLQGLIPGVRKASW